MQRRMFTPIKNFITYIQKNASSNSIFGGNNTAEETAKIETENMKIEQETATEIATAIATMNSESEIPKETVEKDPITNKEDEEQEKVQEMSEETKDSSSLKPEEPETKTTKVTTTSTVSTENSCEFEEDDIEAQIESSIMLKKPVTVPATNSSEILEVKKTSNSNCSIVISHDFNRTQALSPIDDELNDFRHDPTEVLGTTSSPCHNQQGDELCSVGSAEEALERDAATADQFVTEEEEEVEDIETEEEQKLVDEDTDLEMIDEEKDNEQKEFIDIEDDVEEEDQEEPFFDLNNFKISNVIVLDEVDLNASTNSIDTNNTTDDPLAIACEEQEAFAADKAAALEELNLLDNSQTSHDEDTRTTTEDDLQWLKTDLDDNQPSCSNKVLLKDNVSEVTPEKEERNGEGSDSGLGSETSALHTTTTSISDTSQLNMTAATPTQTPTQAKVKDSEKLLQLNQLKSTPKDPPKPYRSNLKRRLEVDDDVVEGLGSLTATNSSLSDRSSITGSLQKKPKRSINFDTVQIYYFPRQQGFSCVPSAGGCTLGMGARHVAFKTLTLAEHAAELRRAHRMHLQEINPRGSSSDDSEESEEDYLSEGSGSDLDGESNGFLQPVSPKQRRALLKAAGIRKIDPSEKADCRNIRNSREVCGCTCRDFCDPETCACSQSGIKCQVDRDMFPCGCSRDACGNTIGRVEFNPTRVRTHYIHTLMRLEMENRQQQNPYSSAVASPIQPTPCSYYQTHLQPQSNYSSGYASPAYNTASELHQQTAASSYYLTQNPSTSNGLYGQQSSLEMTHNTSAATATVATATQYGIDSLDASLFGGTNTGTPSYGELMPVTSYHYGNVQAQALPFNSYHNTPYINANNANATTTLNTPNTYSSCAVPSIPPYGTATTTEATGVYHSVSNLTSLETTTAPSCSVSGTTSLENDANANFISLSTPLASSSRLSQINDLLQHNRNATTALVAVSQNIAAIDNSSAAAAAVAECTISVTVDNLQTNTSSSCSSINMPTVEEAHKNCMAYKELEPPLKPAHIVAVNESDINGESAKPTAPTLPDATVAAETLHTEVVETTSSPLSSLNAEILPQTSALCKNKQDSNTLVAVSSTIEPSTIEVAAGN